MKDEGSVGGEGRKSSWSLRWSELRLKTLTGRGGETGGARRRLRAGSEILDVLDGGVYQG